MELVKAFGSLSKYVGCQVKLSFLNADNGGADRNVYPRLATGLPKWTETTSLEVSYANIAKGCEQCYACG